MTSDIKVDYLFSPENIGQKFYGIDTPKKDSPLLGSGVYSSHLLHFDPVTSGGSVKNTIFKFDGDIVAVIANNDYLKATDSIFGAAKNYAKGGDRRTESHDSFTLLASDTLQINEFKVGGQYIDNLRVITKTADVPEPASTLAVVALGAVAAGSALKKKQSA